MTVLVKRAQRSPSTSSTVAWREGAPAEATTVPGSAVSGNVQSRRHLTGDTEVAEAVRQVAGDVEVVDGLLGEAERFAVRLAERCARREG